MKRFTSILMILMIMLTFMSTVSLAAYAEDGAETSTPTLEIDTIEQLLGVDLGFVDEIQAKLTELKTTLFGYVDRVVNFIKSNETYKNIAKAILAVIAILLFPVFIGLIVVVYVTIGGMILFAGALVGIVEIIMSIAASMIY